MNAFLEIIEKLVASIPPQTWLEQSDFPFPDLKNPQSSVFDVCLFQTDAQGAYGFLWVAFEDIDDLLIFPFALARYKEDGDLISMPPWSLRDAASDRGFYAAWRFAQRQRNPLLTARKGSFWHKKYDGQANFVAINLGNNSKSISVRLDFQTTYKIFRSQVKHQSKSLEPQILVYLSGQSVFTQFPRLTGLFEYHKGDSKSCVAMGMIYTHNNGSLFPAAVALLHKARFFTPLQEKEATGAWHTLLGYMESLGRLLGYFHTAMSLAPRNAELASEQPTADLQAIWFGSVCTRWDIILRRILALQKNHPAFLSVFNLLPQIAEDLKEQIGRNLEHLGARIQCHGNIHLGNILLGIEDLVLVGYDSDDFDDVAYRQQKHPCFKDMVSVILSLRFAWYFTGRSGAHLMHQAGPATLSALENHFVKFYKNSLHENAASLQLYPSELFLESLLFRFCFLMKICKEIVKERADGSPRMPLWLHILQDFILQEDFGQGR